MHAGWVRPSTPFNVQWILPFGIILFPMATQLDPNDKEPKPGLFLFNVAVQPGRDFTPQEREIRPGCTATLNRNNLT